MTTTYDMSLKQLQKAYIKAQKKVWRYQRKMEKSKWTRTYDPYGTYKHYASIQEEWKRSGINVAHELKRREVWLIDPGLHNRVNIG